VILGENPNGILVFRDELISLLLDLDKEEKCNARSFFMSAWNGDSGYTFDRIIRGTCHIEHACLSLMGAATPSRISRYIANVEKTGMGGDGLIQRFGFMIWPDIRPEWINVDKAPNRDAREAAFAAFDRLDKIAMNVRIVAIAAVALAIFPVTNFVYHFIRKPTEIFFPVSHALNKLPAETWRQYGPLFNQYSTTAIPPELLAALAQVESAGNPIALTYWRWHLTWHPFEIYQPASSAVGMYQMTDAAFADARHYCIHHHTVIEDKGWSIWHSCWFNAFYSRVLPNHAIELTAVSLERNVAQILARRPNVTASSPQKEDLATIIHLCGAGPATTFARRGFRLLSGERCGDHSVAFYLAEVNALKRQFRRLAAER
jgi:Protein of unknown function (DUF3987)/Transglycosylase SLT domain